ncbi:hypothetical protein ACFQ05_07070 [Amycolatopsis umgeniensis]|uniref:Uncharacterized protein n=1 Tax=Amycolatopsis umgeniensis TaxID=336628 RepID=A0A841B278_9PSEU|nr:hypothetical protein [Amycolatopsis umgeniensis]MBB5853041.1 hypothetical protein [Amycolatopsis umgeniensis]
MYVGQATGGLLVATSAPRLLVPGVAKATFGTSDVAKVAFATLKPMRWT